MTVTFQLPVELEQSLQSELADVGAAAKEAFLVTLYRGGKITLVALARALGVDRLEAEEVLQKHHVTEDLGVPEDYLTDVEALRKLMHGGR